MDNFANTKKMVFAVTFGLLLFTGQKKMAYRNLVTNCSLSN
jgi:hypothetical protein